MPAKIDNSAELAELKTQMTSLIEMVKEQNQRLRKQDDLIETLVKERRTNSGEITRIPNMEGITVNEEKVETTVERTSKSEPLEMQGGKRSSRRGLLKKLAAAAVAGVAITVPGAKAAFADSTYRGNFTHDVSSTSGLSWGMSAAPEGVAPWPQGYTFNPNGNYGLVGITDNNASVYYNSDIGVLGMSTSGFGVVGRSAGTSAAVLGSATGTGANAVEGNSSNGTGLYGFGQAGYGAQIWGSKAQLYLYPDFSGLNTGGPPTTYNHNAGELYVDYQTNSHKLWLCTNSGSVSTVGTFKKVMTNDLGFQPLPASQRIFKNLTVNINDLFTGIDPKSTIQSAATGVPFNNSQTTVKAIYCAVQAIPTALGGLSLYPNGGTDPGSSNWAAIVLGNLNLFYMVIPLGSDGLFSFRSHLAGRVFIDVAGYFVY